MSSSPKLKRKKSNYKWNADAYNYPTDYNDHFETPLVAYQDILPLLDGIQSDRAKHVLYDPYYCNGRTATLLKDELGFDQVIHEKRDFYKDVQDGTVPDHDTLLTNPPYSDDHKEQCLDICLQQLLGQDRASFILMPNYIAARSYYRTLLQKNNALDHVVLYVVPAQPYEYDHPEGTGKEIPPFASIWYCLVGRDRVDHLVHEWERFDWSARKKNHHRPKLVRSLPELEQLGAIPTGKRPNPRQRKKRRKAAMETKLNSTNSNDGNQSDTNRANSQAKDIPHKKQSNHNKKSKSKYRDGQGKRVKKRF